MNKPAVLVLGGTGIIGQYLVQELSAKGYRPLVLSRSGRPADSSLALGADYIAANVRDSEAVRKATGSTRFAATIDLLSFDASQLQMMVRCLGHRAGHYLFVSSATVSGPAVTGAPIRESGPLISTPHWEYPENKIRCETVLRETAAALDFPATIVRPYITYSEQRVPFGIWESHQVLDRFVDKRPIVPGREVYENLTALTHSSDLARAIVSMIGNERALGRTVQVASPEVITWKDVYEIAAEIVGYGSFEVLPEPETTICRYLPELRGKVADRKMMRVFSQEELLRVVPGFTFHWTVASGLERAISLHLRHAKDRAAARADGVIDRIALGGAISKAGRRSIGRYSRSLFLLKPNQWLRYQTGRSDLVSQLSQLRGNLMPRTGPGKH